MRFYMRICPLLLFTFIALRLILPSVFYRFYQYDNKSQSESISLMPGKNEHVELNETMPDLPQMSEEMYYRERPYMVEPYRYDVMIMPKKTCSPKTHIVILVHTMHSKIEVRQAIRTTWGSVAGISNPPWPSFGHLNGTFALFFVFGIHKDMGLNDLVVEENDEYGDIILGNFYDSYANMTLKSLLGLKFLLESCQYPRFMIKSDDDMFLNMPAIMGALEEVSDPRSILGPLCVHSKVYRNGKWGLTKEEFPFEIFPPYYAGSAYIISKDLWKELFNLSFYVPRIHIDDVYITGILGRILNITKVKRDGFAYWNSKPASACDIKTLKVLTTTRMKAEDMKRIWNSLKAGSECQVTSSL